MLIWLSSTNYRTEFWFGLVWYGFSILIWFGGSPAFLAPLGPPLPPTASTSLHTRTMDGQEKKQKKKYINGVGYRVAAQLKFENKQLGGQAGIDIHPRGKCSS